MGYQIPELLGLISKRDLRVFPPRRHAGVELDNVLRDVLVRRDGHQVLHVLYVLYCQPEIEVGGDK